MFGGGLTLPGLPPRKETVREDEPPKPRIITQRCAECDVEWRGEEGGSCWICAPIEEEQ